MPLLNDFIKVFDAPPYAINAPTAPSQHTAMQSMGSMEVFPPFNLNTPISSNHYSIIECTTNTNKHLKHINGTTRGLAYGH